MDPETPFARQLAEIAPGSSSMPSLHAGNAFAFAVALTLCLPAALRLQRLPFWLGHPVRWLAARSYALYLMHLTILVDIAERSIASSPYDDPMTAVQAVDRIHDGMRQLSFRHLPAARHGDAKGVVNFVIQDNRVRFEIDEDAAARTGIAISSKLLSLAVQPGPRGGRP